MGDDKVNDAQGATYTSSVDSENEESVEVEEAVEGEVLLNDDNFLRNIAKVPDSVFGSALLAAIKHRSEKKAIDAYAEKINAYAGVVAAESNFNDTVLRQLQTIEKLNDAETIHKADKAERDANLKEANANLVRAEDDLAQAEHVAYLNKQKRNVEKHNADLQHDELMQSTGKSVGDELGLTPEEKEFNDHIESEMSPARFQRVADLFKSKNSLSPEEEAKVDLIVEKQIKALNT